MAERLWVCHRCKLMGNGFEAARHVDATGHPVDQLTQEMSDAVREYQQQERTQRVADLIAYADFKRKAASGSR